MVFERLSHQALGSLEVIPFNSIAAFRLRKLLHKMRPSSAYFCLYRSSSAFRRQMSIVRHVSGFPSGRHRDLHRLNSLVGPQGRACDDDRASVILTPKDNPPPSTYVHTSSSGCQWARICTRRFNWPLYECVSGIQFPERICYRVDNQASVQTALARIFALCVAFKWTAQIPSWGI